MVSKSLNKKRISEMHSAMTDFVDRGEMPGLVTLISRGDEVHVDTIGVLAIGGMAPMRRDTIFRIASITKPITAAAAMILVDHGKLRLDDAVDRWLPELANRRVLRSIGSELDDTVPANRPITVRDLQTSCFGFGSVMAMPNTYPIQKPIREGRLGGDGLPRLSETPGTDEWMRRLGALPLMYQPGERWTYNASSDVLGVLIARVSGKSFDAFLHERLLDPLGMKDTSFSVPPTNLDRLPDLYQRNPKTKSLDVFDSGVKTELRTPPAFESGAGGLVSTADDYFAFCRMMLNKGVLKGNQILSQSCIEMMTRDQLTPSQREGADIFFNNHSSWGFGMAVNIRRTEPWTVPGRFGWDGGFGTSAYSDPKNDFIGILLTQRTMDSPESSEVLNTFWLNAYRSLET